MGAHGVAPTWPAQSGRPQGGAQVILERVGAHRVVPSWFVFRFWSLLPFGVEIEWIYLQLGGPTLALNRLGATWVVPRWISRLGATWVVPR